MVNDEEVKKVDPCYNDKFKQDLDWDRVYFCNFQQKELLHIFSGSK